MKTIDCTPVGLQTPEGVARVNKATKAFEDSHSAVANAAQLFILGYSGEIRAMLTRLEDEDALEEFNDLLALIKGRERAQEEFLRALGGVPPLAT